MGRREIPELRLPEMGPLTRAALLFDFVETSVDYRDIDWDSEIASICYHRLAGVAQRMIEQSDLVAPERVLSQLRDSIFFSIQMSSLAALNAASALETLTESGIEFVVTKGPGISSQCPRLADRPYTDIDILVPTRRFDHSLELLARLGYEEQERNMMPWAVLGKLCREAVNLHSETGGSIDVHHRIPPWYWGTALTFAALYSASSEVVTLGGVRLRCASAADNLLVSALHIVSDKNSPGETLMAWRDVLTLARAVEPEELLIRARNAGLCGWLVWVLRALPEASLPPEIVELFANEDSSISGVARLRAITPPGCASSHNVRSQLLRLPALNATTYMVGLTFPSDRFLRSRVGNAPGRHLRWWRSAFANWE
jgi:hypothetical protein